MLFHYHVLKGLPLVPILSQVHPICTFLPYFHKIHSNVTLLSMPRSSKCSPPFGFSNQNIVFLIYLCVLCLAYLILLDLISLLFGEVYKL
jgi:hypothetical protein